MRNIRNSITHQLAPLFRRVSLVHNRALLCVELRAVEAHIWVNLQTEGSMTVGQLQRTLGLRGSTLTGALDRLETRGLISREVSAGDRRSFVLTPLKVPAKQRRLMDEALQAADAECWKALSAAERSQLHTLLAKANNGLAAQEA